MFLKNVVLKELRESLSACTLIKEMKIMNEELIEKAAKESNELVAIFVTSIQTTRKSHGLK